MGCISSKDVVTRSMSIRKELNHSFNTTSTAWEELLTSHNGNDLFALVSMAAKLRTNHLEASSQAKNLSNSCQLIPEIKEETEAKTEPDCGRFARSRSCQVMGSKEMLEQDPGNDEINGSKLDSKDKNLRGSRSFHTVEEYDALMERIHNFTARNAEPFEDRYYPWEVVRLQESDCLDENKNEGFIQTSTEDSMEKEQDLHQDSLRNSDASGNDVQEDGMLETGWKRKAIAKGLKSLDISAVEFPSVAKFRQRIHVEGHVYSPGTYVTPKFGSYNVKAATRMRENEVGDDDVFSAELVAAFEDCMKQLQIEEERILCAMDQQYSAIDDEIEID